MTLPMVRANSSNILLFMVIGYEPKGCVPNDLFIGAFSSGVFADN